MVLGARINPTRALKYGRAHAEARMLDTCTITGPGTRTWDEDTGTFTQTPTVIYQGKCEIKAENVEAAQVDQQGRMLTVVKLTLKLPVDSSAAVREGQSVHIDTAVNDPALAGRAYTVGAFTAGSYQTARRIPLEEQQ